LCQECASWVRTPGRSRRSRARVSAPRWRETSRRTARRPPTPARRRTRGRTPAASSPDRGPATSPSQTPWCRYRASASRPCAWCRATGSPARPLPRSGGPCRTLDSKLTARTFACCAIAGNRRANVSGLPPSTGAVTPRLRRA